MTRIALTTCLLLAACSGQVTDAGDGPNDSFLATGKTDTGGVQDGTPEAAGVLKLANEASQSTLDNDVGLSSKAADNIVAYRVGDDGQPGTSDDQTFDTLAELDAVPYVGPAAFKALLAYAKAHGYITASGSSAGDTSTGGSSGSSTGGSSGSSTGSSDAGGTGGSDSASALTGMAQGAASCEHSTYHSSTTCYGYKPCGYPVEGGTDQQGTTTVSIQCSLTGAVLTCSVSSAACSSESWTLAPRTVSGTVNADGSFDIDSESKVGDDANFTSKGAHLFQGKVVRSGGTTLSIAQVDAGDGSYRSGTSDGLGSTYENDETWHIWANAVSVPLAP